MCQGGARAAVTLAGCHQRATAPRRKAFASAPPHSCRAFKMRFGHHAVFSAPSAFPRSYSFPLLPPPRCLRAPAPSQAGSVGAPQETLEWAGAGRGDRDQSQAPAPGLQCLSADKVPFPLAARWPPSGDLKNSEAAGEWGGEAGKGEPQEGCFGPST